jgi:hypothetical protein
MGGLGHAACGIIVTTCVAQLRGELADGTDVRQVCQALFQVDEGTGFTCLFQAAAGSRRSQL